MHELTSQELRRMWPNADPILIEGLSVAQYLYPKFGITTWQRLAHFWAQCSHECGNGTELVENLNYNWKVLLSQWPSHFTEEQAMKYGRVNARPANQIAIGNIAYGGRMGNAHSADTDPMGDGYRFRGRGLIQTTGRNGYTKLASLTGLALLDHPEYVISPQHALHCALAEFESYIGILGDCDRDDIVAVTRKINGGTIGLDDRKAQLARWKDLILSR